MIYADPVIMYEARCPQCNEKILLYREDLEKIIECDNCCSEFEVSPPIEEVGELIYSRTG